MTREGNGVAKDFIIPFDDRDMGTCREGTSVMRASKAPGGAGHRQVPKLCATDMVDAFGSCRLCLVEIEGRNGTPASCTTPVAEGMVVHTQTDRVKDIRRGVMELYISDHPLDCLTCAANGDCELQDMAGAVGLRDVRYGYEGDNHFEARAATAKPTPTTCPRTRSNPYFTYDPSKCIVCSRCVRACEEVQGTFALTIEGAGFDSRVSPACMRATFLSSECVLRRLRAGLPDRDAAGKIGDRDRPADTIGGDHLRLLRRRLFVQGGNARRRSLVRMVPWKDGKANRGHSCVKGRFAWGYATTRTASCNR
jgi:formate dehydrogenase major subunit